MHTDQLMLMLFPDDQPDFCSEFSAELETNINTVLCAVQTLVKRREREQQGDVKRGENDAVGTVACIMKHVVWLWL